MRLIYSLLSVFALAAMCIFLSNCAAPKTTTSSAQDGKYSEDLSTLRPKLEAENASAVTEPTNEKKSTPYVEPKYTINKQLDTVLDSIDRIHISRNAIDGFTIQVYSGRREEALNAKKTLANVLPDLESEIQFTEPIFRVKVGKYFTRQEAQEDYTDVKRYFPAAIIIPEKIATR
jgi:hypothetical protein